MQRGEVDMCIVGTDRTIATGDVANKVGTYLKALAAKDNNVPFYVALPSSTIDWKTTDLKKIPIEERNSEELSYVEGLDENNNVKKVLIYPKKSKAMNLAFDVTPAKYVTGLITEKGVCEASKEGLKKIIQVSNFSAYIILIIAVMLGTTSNGFAKSAQGFTLLIPSIMTAITIVLCMYTLSLVMKAIPVGITYASFAGLCIVATVLVVIVKFNQIPNLYTIIGLGLIIAGVLMVNLIGKTNI